jgi:hypothetical protein
VTTEVRTGRLLSVFLASSLGLLGTAYAAAVVRGKHGIAPLLFLLAFAGGLAAGFLAVQSAFRLGRSMRKGYDPAEASGPSANLLWESVKTLWGFGMFVLKALLGGILWSLLFVLFQRV